MPRGSATGLFTFVIFMNLIEHQEGVKEESIKHEEGVPSEDKEIEKPEEVIDFVKRYIEEKGSMM